MHLSRQSQKWYLQIYFWHQRVLQNTKLAAWKLVGISFFKYPGMEQRIWRIVEGQGPFSVRCKGVQFYLNEIIWWRERNNPLFLEVLRCVNSQELERTCRSVQPHLSCPIASSKYTRECCQTQSMRSICLLPQGQQLVKRCIFLGIILVTMRSLSQDLDVMFSVR